MNNLFKLNGETLEIQNSLLWNRACEKEFEEALKGMITRYEKITVDLTRCVYINSSYISILVFYHYLCFMRNVHLKIRISSRHKLYFTLEDDMTAMNIEIVPANESEVPKPPIC